MLSGLERLLNYFQSVAIECVYLICSSAERLLNVFDHSQTCIKRSPYPNVHEIMRKVQHGRYRGKADT